MRTNEDWKIIGRVVGLLWLAVLLLAIFGWLSGCTPLFFTCQESAQCEQGKSCVTGSCAAADPGCGSGWRWDDTAGAREGRCAAEVVEADGGVFADAADHLVVSINLAPYLDEVGIYSDGLGFPRYGGLSRSGSACSAQLLTQAAVWSSTPILGKPDQTNTVLSDGQVVALPRGKFAQMRVIATATFGPLDGDFLVSYDDGSSSMFHASISDWLKPPSQLGYSEAIAVVLPYYNYYNGVADKRANFLYGYAFDLDSMKIAASVRFPDDTSTGVPPADPGIVIFAVSLTR